MHYGWTADEDLHSMLPQVRLVEDHLAPYLDVIHGATLPEDKHAILWCICNLIPLRQSGYDALRPLHYEHLYKERDRLETVLALALHCNPRAVRPAATDRPSGTTTMHSPAFRGEDNLGHWCRELPPESIRRILDIAAAFGLDDLYGAGPMPLRPAPGGSEPAQLV